MILFRLLLFIFTLCLPFSSHAAENNLLANIKYPSTFNLDAANQILDNTNPDELAKKGDTQLLQNAISAINKLKIQAKDCISDNNEELEKLSKFAPPPPVITDTDIDTQKIPATEDKKYIDEKKQGFDKQAAACRLFIIRADEVTDNLAEELRIMLKSQLLYADVNAFENFIGLPTSIQRFKQTFDRQIFWEASGTRLFNTTKIIIFAILFIVSIAISVWLKYFFHSLSGEKTAKKYSHQIIQATLCVLSKYIILLLPSTVFAIFMTIIDWRIIQHSYLTLFSYALFSYTLFIALACFFFSPPKPAITVFSSLPEHIAKILLRRIKIFATICLITFISYSFFHAQVVSEALYHASRTIFITLIAINLTSIIWLFQKLPKLSNELRILRFIINTLLTVILLSILISEWLGYHQLSYYLLKNIVITAVAAFTAKILHKLVKAGLGGSGETAKGLQETLKQHLGLDPSQRLIELSCLRSIIYFIIWFGFFLYLLKTWGLGETNFHRIIITLLDGFQISNIDIIPSRIIIALLVFICLTIMTRFLKTYVIRNTNQHLTRGNRESLGAIVNYIGIASAILIGLLLAGINLSSIMIIAGALSVGIGFGLQKIANDFISGIILLIERPIKPGDRIIAGDIEGYVRKVGIRSTHIITTQRSDVVVPNSDIIANNVTNYTLYDSNYYVIVDVGVAYGSDTDLVKSTLLEIAEDNPQVISDRQGYEPTVYFKAFGDSTLEFSVWCLINDANLKGNIKSALNFQIEKKFREYGIQIAFPQRDINIKSWPGKMPKQTP